VNMTVRGNRAGSAGGHSRREQRRGGTDHRRVGEHVLAATQREI
jgi:hypothetical protein